MGYKGSKWYRTSCSIAGKGSGLDGAAFGPLMRSMRARMSGFGSGSGNPKGLLQKGQFGSRL